MFLLRGSVAALARQAAASRLVPHLTEQFRFQFGYYPSPFGGAELGAEHPGVAGPVDGCWPGRGGGAG